MTNNNILNLMFRLVIEWKYIEKGAKYHHREKMEVVLEIKLLYKTMWSLETEISSQKLS